MKKIAISVFMLITPLALFGCGDDKEKIFTVQEFKEDENIRKEWMAKCKENPGELREHPNCINAFEGEKKLRSERLIEKYQNQKTETAP